MVGATWLIWMLALACIGFVIVLVWVSASRALTHLEAILLQLVILVTGVWASYLFSQRSAEAAAERAKAAAEQLVKARARSAFRRVKSLYGGLFYVKSIIDKQRNLGRESESQVIEVIEAVVDQHVSTVEDAMGDWRDMVPDEVKDLEHQVGVQGVSETEDFKR